MNIAEEIGSAALIEQLGEECAELGKAALKLARKQRGENPTPKTMEECIYDVHEEMADVLLCIWQTASLDYISFEKIFEIIGEKDKRWRDRIREWKG